MAGGGGGADVVVALLPASRSAAFALGLALGAAAGGVLAAITTRRMLDSAKSKSTTSTRPNDQPLVLAIETLTDAVRGLAQTYDADRQAAKLNGSRYQSHAGGSFESASLSSSSSTQLGTDGFRTPLEDAAWDEEPAEDEFYDARSRSNSSAASVVAQARHLATGAAPAAGENDDDVEAMEVAAAAASDPRAFAAAVNGALRAQKVVGSSGEEIDATFYVKVDHARESKEFQSVFNMLKTAFDADASPTSVNRGQEVYWRYARAYFDLSTSHAAGSDERKRLVEAGTFSLRMRVLSCLTRLP
ncbi:hypothetical protein CAOG_01600 [Capsaspora owczarzaki ATCC 30864]|uniref:hypothetical protein n=1 Tax=Capsaspora owczarzaki (strain ATCC 30864) TaxID=595528 RepID=UPI00035222B6|nr:hypothetical protein CAOG_01600 [Capsaspora owczarzaki ATCC 30864]|eukprot:XP_004364468.2 hypothetical protein CAOG_01600 [Capsaspora owczarzaki ATCC 30864]